ncbi:2-(3-amino-3-carboxypropyl)histidine synthase [Sporobolomyces koalae]|uniref:2-(3-amino-3-carboxypropyl)histidine synthase n=1 Tax=Sporobolomyces koalae TaxID=500713 RepID=UPI003170CE79
MSQAPPPLAPTGEEAIHQVIDVEPEAFADVDEAGSLEQAYEVDLTLHEIQKGGYQRIGLQFADEQLHDAVPVYRALRDKLPSDKELYVLADTTYGSCCVDEVAAQHVDADFVVHYGHTCLSPTARLPVLYILTKRAIEPAHAASSLASTSKASLDAEPPKAVVLLYDVGYAHKAYLVADALRTEFEDRFPVVLSHLDKRANLHSHAVDPLKGKGKAESQPQQSHELAEDDMNAEVDPEEPIAPPPPTTVPRAASRYDLPQGVDSIEECALFWIGPESLALTNLLMTHGRCRIWSYDPTMRSCRLESARTNRMLMRRYALVEKAKDADVIGILVGTLGVAAYLPLITHLRELIASHHKKSYTVAVGKLNPAKLANFIEVECFVLVACPENTMVDSKEFLRPIVTPFELELALTSKAWTGQYILDFGELLSSSTFGQEQGQIANDETTQSEGQDGEEDEEAPVYSATTGKYRHPKKYYQNGVKDADDLAAQASALAIRDTNSAISRVLGSAAGEYMSTRTYKGLEPRYGQDAPAVLEMGREGGIARGYGYEHQDQTE